MRIKEASVGLTLLASLVLLLHDYGILEQIAAKRAFGAEAQVRFSDVLDRIHRLSSTPGSDVRPFQEIADSELQYLRELDRERERLRGELWLFRRTR